MHKRKILYSDGNYVAFWSDGEFAVSDGVGYVGELTKHEVEKLYLVLKSYFEPKVRKGH